MNRGVAAKARWSRETPSRLVFVRREPWLPSVLLAMTLGCGQADGPPVVSSQVELGEIEAGTFTRYADGAEEPIIMGLQGGFHIIVDARLADDPGADEYTIRLVLTHDDGAPLTAIDHLRAPENDEGNPTFPQMIVFIDDPAAAAERDVVLQADVEAENVAVERDTARLFLLAEDEQ